MLRELLRNSTKFAVLLILAGSTTANASGKKAIPELGNRAYVIEKNSSDPVVIKEMGATPENAVILRDPSMDTQNRPKRVDKPVVKQKAVAKVKDKAGQMRFGRMKIEGHLKNPRVEFQSEYLKVGISEEDYSQDFFQKLGDTLKDSEF